VESKRVYSKDDDGKIYLHRTFRHGSVSVRSYICGDDIEKGEENSKGQAVDLQTWALEESGTKEFLDSLPELPKNGKIKPGLYVSQDIDELELDGGH